MFAVSDRMFGRAVGTDCRAFTQIEEASIPVTTELFTFDPPADSIDHPSAYAVLFEVGLRGDEIELLRQNSPPSGGAITAISSAESVIDSNTIGGKISYYFDGYLTTETPGLTIFDQGEPIRFINVLYEDSWSIGLMILCCIDMRGNVDGDVDDQIDVADVIYLVDYMFEDGSAPPCFDESDVDGDGDVNVADLICLIDYVFQNGPTPALCP